MNQTTIDQNISRHNTLNWCASIFSLVFVFVLANGYYNLFITKNVTLAILAAAILPILAWLLAKTVGRDERGIQGNKAFFALLLVLSAVGVFNSLMINLEGKSIYQEAIDDAEVKFKNLSLTANNALKSPVFEGKRDRVEALKHMFFEEINNPLNCGQGSYARGLAEKIKIELPAFQLLSGKGKVACKNVEQIIASYDATIEKLLANSKEFTEANYADILTVKNDMKNKEPAAQDKLNKLKSDINSGGNLLTVARLELEDIADIYQKLALELSKYAPTINFPKALEMDTVRNLGEWSKFPDLILKRLNKPSTYLYLALSVSLDWMLVYFFLRLSESEKQLPNKTQLSVTADNINSPWSNT